MKVNNRAMFSKDYQRVRLDEDGRSFIHFTRFVSGPYKLMFSVAEPLDGRGPRLRFIQTSIAGDAKKTRYTPFIYVFVDNGSVQVQTTSYGSLPIAELDVFLAEMQKAREVAACIKDDFITPLLEGGEEGLRDSGLMLSLNEGFKPNDIVTTPRFLKVRLTDVFETPQMMQESGYTEPTHFHSNGMEVYGRSIGDNSMEFAAARK